MKSNLRKIILYFVIILMAVSCFTSSGYKKAPDFALKAKFDDNGAEGFAGKEFMVISTTPEQESVMVKMMSSDSDADREYIHGLSQQESLKERKLNVSIPGEQLHCGGGGCFPFVVYGCPQIPTERLIFVVFPDAEVLALSTIEKECEIRLLSKDERKLVPLPPDFPYIIDVEIAEASEKNFSIKLDLKQRVEDGSVRD